MTTPLRLVLPFILLCLLTGSPVVAQNGTWIQLSGGNASGSWQTGGNWAGSIIASGTDNTANFTQDITADSIVALDAPTPIGNIIFGDTAVGTPANWTIGNGGNASNTLTLSSTGNSVVTVNPLGTGASSFIDAQITGSNGLTKNGTGRLVLNNAANNYTGTISNSQFTLPQFGNATFATHVQRGRLVLGSSTAAGAGNILVQETGGTAFLDLNGTSISNNVGLNNDSYLFNSNNSTTATLGGDLMVRGYARVGGSTSAETGTVVLNGDINFYVGSTRLLIAPNGGLVVFNGSSNNGTFVINGGVFRANDATNINSSGNLTISGGVLETSSDFTRSVGSGSGLVDVGASSAAATSGFSAVTNNITVSLGGLATPTNLTWGASNFLQSTSTLVLNAATANSTLTFANAINLNGTTRTMAVNASTAVVSGNLTNGSGTAGLTKTGAGTLALTGTNTFNGDTTVSAGTLRGNTSSLPTNIINNAAVVFDQSGNGTFSPVISGSGTLEKTGAGALTLASNNTFTGAALVSEGTLVLGNNGSLGTTAGNTTVSSGATLDLNGRNVGGELVRISGSGVGGAGALVNNSGSAAASQGGFRLELLADATIGGTGRFDTAFGGTVINAGTNTLTKTGANIFTINVGSTSMGTFNIDQGSVVVVNSGTALGDTTFGTNVASGASLQFFNNTVSEISNSENITLAGGAELAGTTANATNVLAGSVTLSGGNATIRVEPTGQGTMRLEGSITGAGGFNKISAGTLLLTGSGDYTGATTVTGGTLLVNGSISDTSGVSVGVVGTLGGNGSIGGPVTVDGFLNPGTSPGTLNFGDNLTLNSTATLNLEITGIGGGQFDVLNGDGANIFTLGGTLALDNTNYISPTLNDSITVFTNWFDITGSFASITGTDLGGGLYWDTSALATSGTLTVIPEPGTVVLLGIGSAFMLWNLRRRRVV